MDKLDLNINGHDNFPDIINNIKDTIDNGDKESAKDYLNQLQEYLAKRDNNILELQTTGEKILRTLEEKSYQKVVANEFFIKNDDLKNKDLENRIISLNKNYDNEVLNLEKL